MNLTKRLLNGDKKALATLITLVENREEGYQEVIDSIFSHTGKSYRLGVTGPPGAGKSTLVNKLTNLYRKEGYHVGILACDPSSPFTHGSLLGDRIRMRDITLEDGVFIRSMATKGTMGGLSLAASDASLLLEAYGVNLIILETVGTGQAEVDVAKMADCTVLVLTPQSGDAVQALKAGLMEIADVVALNKCDQGGAERCAEQLQSVLDLSKREWSPPLVKTTAFQGGGLKKLKKEIDNHRVFLQKNERPEELQKQRVKEFLAKIIEDKLRDRWWRNKGERILDQKLDNESLNNLKPYQIAEEVVSDLSS